MIKVPVKMKKAMTTELKRFDAHIQALIAKGKTGTEEDARIIINDVLAYVLGYDKYNDLKTEFKDRNGRLDYIVKLSEGPNARKKDKFDFVIEAKAAHCDLKMDYVNQTLTYCLKANIDHFILTNAKDWQLYKVIKTKNKSDAILIWEASFTHGCDIDSLTDDMYIFSKHAFIDNKWEEIADHSKATDVSDVMSVIISDRMIKNIARMLRDIHDVRVSEEVVQEVILNKIFKDSAAVNKGLLKRLNVVEVRAPRKKENLEDVTNNCPPCENNVEILETTEQEEKIA